MKQATILKALAATAGAGLTGVATYMNAEAIAAAETWASPLVVGTVMLTISGAMALPLAEHAHRTGQWLKAAFLVLFFTLVLAGSLMNTLARTASLRDGQIANGNQMNARAQLAAEAYKAAQATVVSECSRRGPLCRAAETAVSTARLQLVSAPPAKSSDPSAERLAAILGIPREQVALYVPLILPVALELGGFLLLALGLSPRRSVTSKLEPTLEMRSTAPAVAELLRSATHAAPLKPKSGTKGYWMARLEREFPLLASQVLAGKISVHAACVTSGLRKRSARAPALVPA